MNLTRVLVNIGGVVGLSLALTAIAQPPAPTAPASKEQPSPTPAAPAVPSKDAPAAAPARVVSKEAADLLEKARAAGKAVNDITANVEVSMKNDGEGEASKGRIVFALKDGRIPFGNWRIETAPTNPTAGSASAPAPGKTVAYDGATLRTIDPSKKEMTETPVGERGFPSGEEGMLMPMWFFEQRNPDMMAGMKPTIVEQVIEGEPGAHKIGDEKVTIVRQVRTATLPVNPEEPNAKPRVLTETVRLSLGADNLPRRAQRTIEVSGDEPFKQEVSHTYEGLKVNTSPGTEVFALKAPEGYTTREVAAPEEGSSELKVKVGDAAPDFNLKDADGKEYKLADFKGKVVLLDFWATWCGPCVKAMPSIQKISETFKDKAVAVIGVNTWERKATAGPEFIKKKGYTYLNLLKGDDLAKAYGISGIPTLILIDKEGKILHTAVGFGPGEEEELTKLINEKLK